MQDDQIHYFTDNGIVINNHRLSGPVVAEMLRGPECADIIGGLASETGDTDDVPFSPVENTGPVAPIQISRRTMSRNSRTRSRNSRTRNRNSRARNRNRNNRRRNKNRDEDNWFAYQWE